jgi:hypothetical protein
MRLVITKNMQAMKKSVIFYSVILLKISCSTFSQEQTDIGNKLSGFHIGISHTDLKEESLNRAIHKGPGLMGAIYFERSDGKSVKKVKMELGSSFLSSDYEGETSSYLFSGSASFSYLQNLEIAPPAFGFYLGGRVKAATAIEYFDNWDESHFYWTTSYSLGVDFRGSYSFGRNSRISLEVDFPVLSLVSRPPSKFMTTQSSPALAEVLRELNQDLQFLSVGDFRNLNIQLKFSLRNPKKFVPSIFWKFSDMHINMNGSNPMKYISHTLGIEYRF